MSDRKLEQSQLVSHSANLLKEIRIRQCISQEAVYAITMINVARIENGSKDITLRTLKTLCDLYDTPLEDFFLELQRAA